MKLIRNIAYDPKPVGRWITDIGADDCGRPSITYGDGITITANYPYGDAWARIEFNVVNGERYHVSGYLAEHSGVDSFFNGVLFLYRITNMAVSPIENGSARFSGAGRRYEIDTVIDADRIGVRLYATNGEGHVRWNRIMACTEPERRVLRQLGLDWFDGGTAPLRGGGIRSSRPRVARPLDWGLAA